MALRDTWRDALLTASFFGLRLDILNTEDEWRSSLVRHSGPRRDGATIDPMGTEARICRCTVIFFERDGDDDDEFAFDDHITRFATFMQTAMQAREPREFVHPVLGSFQAYVENLSARAAAGDPNVIMVQADFVEDAGPAVLAYPELAPVASGQAHVENLAGELDAQLASVRLPASATAAPALAARSTSMVEGWITDANLATRNVDAELSDFSDAVSDALLEINAGTDLGRFTIVRTIHRLHATLRRAAERFRRSQPQVVTHVVRAATSLRALATALYGAADSEARYQDLVRLNDLADPTYLPAGTTVRVLSVNPVGSPGARGMRGGASR